MKILMFSWEYPPVSEGGLARHVQDLSEALVEKGHTVYIITKGERNIPEKEQINGVNVLRSDPVKISSNNFIDDILQLNYQLLEKSFLLSREIEGEFDLVHGHDWLVFWASKVVKHSLLKPLIFTIHATESGRNQGIYNDMQRYINDIEWYSTFEAWKVIVCSNYMKNEVKGLFQLPDDKLTVIENGVNPDNYQTDYSSQFKGKYVAPGEDMIFYVGRIVREKGIQVLIQAMPELLKEKPSTKLIIAGKGNFSEDLKRQARYLGIEDRIYFTGFVSDNVRNKLYQAADVAVFPSLYEPFGIVALEAMCTGTPVIASNVGGMAEFVEHKENGLKVEPNNPYQLAHLIQEVLDNKKEYKKMAKKAQKIVEEKFSWDKIAEKTEKVYKNVLNEYQNCNWNKEIDDTYIDNEEELVGGYRYR